MLIRLRVGNEPAEGLYSNRVHHNFYLRKMRLEVLKLGS